MCSGISMKSAVTEVLAELGGKEKQRTTLKAFLAGHQVFTLLPADFHESLNNQWGALQLASRRWNMPNVVPCANRKPQAVCYLVQLTVQNWPLWMNVTDRKSVHHLQARWDRWTVKNGNTLVSKPFTSTSGTVRSARSTSNCSEKEISITIKLVHRRKDEVL